MNNSPFSMGWLMAMFDLPVMTHEERKVAARAGPGPHPVTMVFDGDGDKTGGLSDVAPQQLVIGTVGVFAEPMNDENQSGRGSYCR